MGVPAEQFVWTPAAASDDDLYNDDDNDHDNGNDHANGDDRDDDHDHSDDHDGDGGRNDRANRDDSGSNAGHGSTGVFICGSITWIQRAGFSCASCRRSRGRRRIKRRR